MIIRNNDYEVKASYTLYLFFYFLAIMFIYVTDLLKKIELYLLVTSIVSES